MTGARKKTSQHQKKIYFFSRSTVAFFCEKMTNMFVVLFFKKFITTTMKL